MFNFSSPLHEKNEPLVYRWRPTRKTSTCRRWRRSSQRQRTSASSRSSSASRRRASRSSQSSITCAERSSESAASVTTIRRRTWTHCSCSTRPIRPLAGAGRRRIRRERRVRLCRRQDRPTRPRHRLLPEDRVPRRLCIHEWQVKYFLMLAHLIVSSSNSTSVLCIQYYDVMFILCLRFNIRYAIAGQQPRGPGPSTGAPPESISACPFCGVVLPDRQSLQIHVADEHEWPTWNIDLLVLHLLHTHPSPWYIYSPTRWENYSEWTYMN